MPGGQHRAQTIRPIRCAVVTISDTRTLETDESGKTIGSLLEAAGHGVIVRELVRDEPGEVRERIVQHCERSDCHAVLTTGGTGLAPRDQTYEAVTALLDKRLDGFGELFRMLSYAEIGPAAMLSRAVAGVRGRTAVFCMPGSVPAVRLAMERLILPELPHIAWLLRG